MSVTQVPLRPIARGSQLKYWLALAALVIAAFLLARLGAGQLQGAPGRRRRSRQGRPADRRRRRDARIYRQDRRRRGVRHHRWPRPRADARRPGRPRLPPGPAPDAGRRALQGRHPRPPRLRPQPAAAERAQAQRRPLLRRPRRPGRPQRRDPRRAAATADAAMQQQQQGAAAAARGAANALPFQQRHVLRRRPERCAMATVASPRNAPAFAGALG